MTVIEAIEEADVLKPNLFQVQNKIAWLSRLDLRVYNEVMLTHQWNEGETDPQFTGYTKDDTETTLLVPEPWAEMYVYYLSAMIDFNNLEYDGFNASNAMFETVYSQYANRYNDEHMPISAVKRYF